MKKETKKITNLFARYFIILLIALGNFYILYKILTPLTLHATNQILSIFTTTFLIENTIHLKHVIIEIAPACVAASAFYLLIALLLSTSDIKFKTRIYAIITAIAILFALNIARIVALTPFTNQPYFETLHWIFWHLISIIFVLVTYLLTIKIYKIKSTPIYSDFKYLKSLTKQKRKKRKTTSRKPKKK